jgi:DNA-binding TFAR19-related protein (PDSD5 family)
MEQKTQMVNAMLAQLLDQNARARLNTLKTAFPEKAQMVKR